MGPSFYSEALKTLCSTLLLLLSLGCQSFTAKKKYLPPKKIYHYGQYEHLIKNAKSHGIDLFTWDHFIMHNDRSNLGRYRTGFYGCSIAAQCEAYGGLAENSRPWLNIVTLKDECRSNVALPNFLYQDSKFIQWYDEQNINSLILFKDFKALCQDNFRLDLTRKKESICEEIVYRYFSDRNVRIVFDEAMPDGANAFKAYLDYNSWYIRDRSCIENIEGEPEEVIRYMADETYWKTPLVDEEKRSYEPIKRRVYITTLFVSALTKSEPSKIWGYFPQILSYANAYSENMESQDLLKLSDVISGLINSYQGCQDRDVFNEKIKVFINAHLDDYSDTILIDLKRANYFYCR